MALVTGVTLGGTGSWLCARTVRLICGRVELVTGVTLGGTGSGLQDGVTRHSSA